MDSKLLVAESLLEVPVVELDEVLDVELVEVEESELLLVESRFKSEESALYACWAVVVSPVLMAENSDKTSCPRSLIPELPESPGSRPDPVVPDVEVLVVEVLVGAWADSNVVNALCAVEMSSEERAELTEERNCPTGELESALEGAAFSISER